MVPLIEVADEIAFADPAAGPVGPDCPAGPAGPAGPAEPVLPLQAASSRLSSAAPMALADIGDPYDPRVPLNQSIALSSRFLIGAWLHANPTPRRFLYGTA